MGTKKNAIRTIGVFTSGGDAPGMNAAIRAVVRTGLSNGLRVVGIERGYIGMLERRFVPYSLGDVANIIQRGGTVLKTSRCPEFHEKKFRKQAVENLQEQGIDGLIAIGGDGTFAGALRLYKEFKFPVIGVPGTIDNDLFGTEVTIGFDTAINTALDAIDKIRDTANSHDRLFLIEVMGRHSGYIALDVGLGGGAEVIVTPENSMSVSSIASSIKRGQKRGKMSSIVVVAEGAKTGNAMQIAEELKAKYKLESRVVILGHVQRGGSPTARDRKVASLLGSAGVEALAAGRKNMMVGVHAGNAQLIPMEDAIRKRKKILRESFDLAKILAT